MSLAFHPYVAVALTGIASLTAEARATPPPAAPREDQRPLLKKEKKVPVLLPAKSPNGRPAFVAIKDLADFAALPAVRQRLIEIAITTASNAPWLPYTYGGGDPATGGFDCSGAMYFVMNEAGLDPPRSSAAQYEWLREEKQLRVVPEDATTVEHASFKALLPGDLLFWSTGRLDGAVRALQITHVAMYLGREKKDGLRIMINATDGRSYRGVKANGYGVYDFRVPAADARSRLVGYGPPPGMAAIKLPAAVAPVPAA